MVASLQISPSNDFILASYRIRYDQIEYMKTRNVEREGSFKSIFFHIYRQMDWRLYVGTMNKELIHSMNHWGLMIMLILRPGHL